MISRESNEQIIVQQRMNIPHDHDDNMFFQYWLINDINNENSLIIKKVNFLETDDIFAGPFNNETELNNFLNNIKMLNFDILFEE